MEAKEIKAGMSNTPWDGILIEWVSGADFEHKHFNQEAAQLSVNETFGKGYNPQAMDELYKALEAQIDHEKGLRATGRGTMPDILFNESETALKNAKL